MTRRKKVTSDVDGIMVGVGALRALPIKAAMADALEEAVKHGLSLSFHARTGKCSLRAFGLIWRGENFFGRSSMPAASSMRSAFVVMRRWREEQKQKKSAGGRCEECGAAVKSGGLTPCEHCGKRLCAACGRVHKTTLFQETSDG